MATLVLEHEVEAACTLTMCASQLREQVVAVRLAEEFGRQSMTRYDPTDHDLLSSSTVTSVSCQHRQHLQCTTANASESTAAYLQALEELENLAGQIPAKAVPTAKLHRKSCPDRSQQILG